MKFMVFGAFMIIAVDCAAKATGLEPQELFDYSNIWLWWLPAVWWGAMAFVAAGAVRE